MVQVFAIGTVIFVGTTKAMIVGYTFLPDADKLQFAYIVVPYPTGYRSAQHLRAISVKDIELVEHGYEAPGVDVLLRYMGGIASIAELCNPEKYQQIMKQAVESLKEELWHE